MVQGMVAHVCVKNIYFAEIVWYVVLAGARGNDGRRHVPWEANRRDFVFIPATVGFAQ